jgi:hypothetical protein
MIDLLIDGLIILYVLLIENFFLFVFTMTSFIAVGAIQQ